METLENIVDIMAAIRNQKKDKKIVIPGIVKNILKLGKEDDISSKLKNDVKESSISKISKELFEKNEEKSYNIVKQLSDYISMVKDKLYDYYSSIKDYVKEIAKVFKVGYTDKNIIEFEDWGTIYYKTVFSNLKRNTPLGWASRYLQKLWICVLKTIKS